MKSVKLAFCLIAFLLSSVLTFAALDVKFTTAIKQTPDHVAAGNEVTFTVSFKPSGGAVNNFKIIGGVSGTQIFERTYASIAADKVKTDSFKWIAIKGYYTAWFELDPQHTAGDSDYSNNKVGIQVIYVESSGSEFVLNDKTTPDINRINKLGNILRDRLNEKTADIFAEKVFAIDLGGNEIQEVKAGQFFKINCRFRRTGPEPPGRFYVELWTGSVQRDCTNNSCLAYTGDTFGTATGDAWVYSNDKGNYPITCILKWTDPAYKEDNTANNTMTQTLHIY